SCGFLDTSCDLLTHDGTHAGSHKPSVHDHEDDLVFSDSGPSGHNGFIQTGLFLQSLYLIRIFLHAERICVDKSSVPLLERTLLRDEGDSLISRHTEIPSAFRANVQIILIILGKN